MQMGLTGPQQPIFNSEMQQRKQNYNFKHLETSVNYDITLNQLQKET